MSEQGESKPKSKKNPNWGARVLIVILFGVGGVFVEYQKQIEPMYRATATIMVESNLGMIDSIFPAMDVGNDGDESSNGLNTLVEIIPSTKLMRQVIMDHDLLNRESFAGKNPSSGSLDSWARRLAARTYAKTREGTHLIDISVIDNDRDLARDLVNWIAAGYIKQHSNRNLAASQVAKSVLTEEAERLKKKLRMAEVALITFRKTAKLVVPIERRQAMLEDSLSDLDREHTRLKVGISQLKGDLEKIIGFGAKPNFDQLRTVPSVTELDSVDRIWKLFTAHEDAAMMLGDDENKLEHHQEVEGKLRARLNSVLADAPFQLEVKIDQLQSESTNLQHLIQSQEEELLNLATHAVEYGVLQREVDATKALYESVLQRIKEVDLTKGFSDEVISIVEEAERATNISPRRMAARSVLLGCLLGIACIFVYDGLKPVLANRPA